MDSLERGGEYLRCASPSWSDPFDGSYSMRFGGRWNGPGTFPVVYLNANRGTAKANARRLLTKGFNSVFVSAEDLDPSELPTLIATIVLDEQYIDIVSDGGSRRPDSRRRIRWMPTVRKFAFELSTDWRRRLGGGRPRHCM